MRISSEGYVARIANATRIQLVIINYEIILDYLNAAKNSTDNRDDMDFDISKARQFLDQLRNSLDMQYTLSKYLMNLYVYVDQQLAYSLFSYDTSYIDEAVKILSRLLEGWKKAEEENDDKTPIMTNTEQLYAGLTYGKNGRLNEYVDTKANRGFKV